MSAISTRAVQDNAGCVFVGHHFAKTSSWCADDLCVGVAWNEDRSTPFSTQDVVGPSHPVSCVEARDFITLELPPLRMHPVLISESWWLRSREHYRAPYYHVSGFRSSPGLLSD